MRGPLYLSPMQIFFYLFGAITIAGAIQGFMAGSKASLIAGGILGTLILVGAFLSKSNPMVGLILVMVGSLGIAGKFVPNFFKGFAIWPAGTLALLSVIAIVLATIALVKK